MAEVLWLPTRLTPDWWSGNKTGMEMVVSSFENQGIHISQEPSWTVNSTTLVTKVWWGLHLFRKADHFGNPQSFRVEPVQQQAGQLNTWATHKKPKSLDSLHPPGRYLQVPLPQQSLPDSNRHHSSLSPSVHTPALREMLQRAETLPPQAEDHC